jgi:hypothetical protein
MTGSRKREGREVSGGPGLHRCCITTPVKVSEHTLLNVHDSASPLTILQSCTQSTRMDSASLHILSSAIVLYFFAKNFQLFGAQLEALHLDTEREGLSLAAPQKNSDKSSPDSKLSRQLSSTWSHCHFSVISSQTATARPVRLRERAAYHHQFFNQVQVQVFTQRPRNGRIKLCNCANREIQLSNLCKN